MSIELEQRVEIGGLNFQIRKAYEGILIKVMPFGQNFYRPDRVGADWFELPEPHSGGEAIPLPPAEGAVLDYVLENTIDSVPTLKHNTLEV